MSVEKTKEIKGSHIFTFPDLRNSVNNEGERYQGGEVRSQGFQQRLGTVFSSGQAATEGQKHHRWSHESFVHGETSGLWKCTRAPRTISVNDTPTSCIGNGGPTRL